MKNFLVFGASGSIGAECSKTLDLIGQVTRINSDYTGLTKSIEGTTKFDGVIWAQGLNLNDTVAEFNVTKFNEVIDANVLYVLETAKILLDRNKISNGSNLVVISSIWSQLGRPNKLTYAVTKSAVSAAVRSMAIDLGEKGIQVNAISPGPIDNPMTRANLSDIQINEISQESPLGRMVNALEVSSLATKFANGEILGVTGQDIVIDAGWGIAKLV